MAAALGFLIAVVIAATGVGGGVLTAPALILILRLPPAESVGTALLFVTVVKSIAVPAYLARKQVNIRVLAKLLAGGVPGVVAGSLLLSRASHSNLSGLVLAIVGATTLTSASLGLFRVVGGAPVNRGERLAWLPPLAGAIGLEVGFSSAGAGALGTTVLLYLTKLSPAEVVGTDLLFGLAVSAIAGGLHFASGIYDSATLMQLVAGGIAGAFAGGFLATRLPARALRTALLIMLMGVGVQLSYQGFRVLAGGVPIK